MTRRVLSISLLLFSLSAIVAAAPMLRLNRTTIGPLSVASGTSPAPRTVEAFNAGDGNLNLTVTASDSWLTAAVQAAAPCTDRQGATCRPIAITFSTNSLTKGTYTGTLTVADPNAWDAPQTITVVLQIGGGVPDSLDLYVSSNGGKTTRRFITGSKVNATTNTQTGGSWLSVALEGTGTFEFDFPYLVTVQQQAGMGEGTYNGSFVTSGAGLPEENKTVNVKLTVTSKAIAVPAPQEVVFRIPQDTPKQDRVVFLSNVGQGALAISEATAATTSGGDWLSVTQKDALLTLSAKVDGIAPGSYKGAVTVKSDAANGDVQIPVTLLVIAQSAPVAAAGGVVNNATFQAGDPIPQGGIVAIFGEQFVYGDAASATAVPLPTKIGETRVLVNGAAAPLYFVSGGQINFQMPYGAQLGTAQVQVERDGKAGNSVSVQVVRAAPRILRLGIGDYGIAVNQDGSFPIPPVSGLNSHRAKRGDTLVIYAIGLGQTSPPATSGAAAPGAEPLARVDPLPKVQIGGGLIPIDAPPLFIGQTPGFVGLYQINVTIPGNTPISDEVPVFLQMGDVLSNTVFIAVGP